MCWKGVEEHKLDLNLGTNQVQFSEIAVIIFSTKKFNSKERREGRKEEGKKMSILESKNADRPQERNGNNNN